LLNKRKIALAAPAAGDFRLDASIIIVWVRTRAGSGVRPLGKFQKGGTKDLVRILIRTRPGLESSPRAGPDRFTGVPTIIMGKSRFAIHDQISENVYSSKGVQNEVGVKTQIYHTAGQPTCLRGLSRYLVAAPQDRYAQKI
jgi:hypothetical protein